MGEPMTILEMAAGYVDRGFSPIPVPYRKKNPVLEGRPALRLTRETLPQYFNGSPANIGLLLGDEYGCVFRRCR